MESSAHSSFDCLPAVSGRVVPKRLFGKDSCASSTASDTAANERVITHFTPKR